MLRKKFFERLLTRFLSNSIISVLHDTDPRILHATIPSPSTSAPLGLRSQIEIESETVRTGIGDEAYHNAVSDNPQESSQHSPSFLSTDQNRESLNLLPAVSSAVFGDHSNIAGRSNVTDRIERQSQMDEQNSQSTISPIIKRRRTSSGVSSTKQDVSNELNALEDENENNCCPICLEPWTNTGCHQACCMPCGHVFGYQCIKNWLKSGNRGARRPCPTCKTPGRVKDLRYLFGLPTRFSAADASISESLKKQLDEERKAHNLTKEKLHEKQKLIATLRNSFKELTRRPSSSRNGVASFGESTRLESQLKLFSSHSTNGESQTAAFDTEARLLFPEKSTHGGVTQFRIRRLSFGASSVTSTSPLVFAKRVSYLDVCSKPESNYRGYIATAVGTKKVHVLAPDLQSATQFSTSTQPTSCLWLSSMSHMLAVGHMTGEVCIFDVRFLSNGPVSQANVCDSGWRLVHSLGEIETECHGSERNLLVSGAPKGVFASKLDGHTLEFQKLISSSRERVCGMSLMNKLVAVTSQSEEFGGCVAVYEGIRKQGDTFVMGNTLGIPKRGLGFDYPFVQAGLIDGDADNRNAVIVCPDSVSGPGFRCWGRAHGRMEQSFWQSMSIAGEDCQDPSTLRGAVGFSFPRSARMDCFPRNCRNIFACFSEERIRLYCLSHHSHIRELS